MHKTGYAIDNVTDPQHVARYSENIASRIYTCLATLPVYLKLILWPSGLHMERVFPVFDDLLNVQVLAGGAMALFAAWQIVWGRARRGLSVTFGILWFAAAQSPNTGIVIPINAFISEHWMYLPTMGVFLGAMEAVVHLAQKYPHGKNIALVFCLAAALALGIVTHVQNKVWRSSESFYENIFQNGGRSYRAHLNLGIYYAQTKDFSKAAAHFRAAIDDSVTRPPAAKVKLHLYLAASLLGAGPDESGGMLLGTVAEALPSSTRIPEAAGVLGKALEISPGNPWAHRMLAMIYDYQGDRESADFHLSAAQESERTQR